MANKYQYREARTPSSKGKKLDHIRVKAAEDGGHTVEHHYAEDGMTFHRPKMHVFGKDEGEDMLNHVAKHMGVKRTPSQEEEEMEGE